MPPTNRRPSLSASLASSPLCRLPPEVRALIYLFTVTQSDELLISKRRLTPQYHPRGLNPNHCMHCHHNRPSCVCIKYLPNVEFYYWPQPVPPRTISSTILRTCRIIYHEAAPFLYRCNRFHFVDPGAVQLFLERADKQHSRLIEAIMLTIFPYEMQPFPGGVFVRTANVWDPVIFGSKKPFIFLRHFTLKSVIIRLRGQHEKDNKTEQENLCSAIAERLPPLKWIHVNGIDVEAVWDLGSVVERPRAHEGDVRDVQAAVSEAWARDGWKNVTLWCVSSEPRTVSW